MKIKNILLVSWTILLLLFRPSILGERYTVTIFYIFLSVTILILLKNISKPFSLSSKRFIAVLLIYFCVSYFFIQGLLLSDARSTVINSCGLIFLAVPCLAMVLNRYQETILKIFINVHYYLSISSIITFIIFILVGLSVDRLPVLANLYDIAGHTSYSNVPLENHLLIFPFSVAWSIVGFFGLEVPRFVGIYTEPGMAQIFFVTSFILTFFVPVKNAYRKRIVILFGSLLLISTAGILNLIVCIVVLVATHDNFKQYVNRIRKSPIIIALGVVVFILLSVQTYRMIQEKFKEASGETRVASFKRGWDQLMEEPIFGQGYYSAFKKDSSGKVISQNFIGIAGVSYQIGLVGILLYLACWMYSFLAMGNRKALCIYIPCFLTLLLSQPSYNDIFTWFLLLLNTRELTILNTQNENIDSYAYVQ